MVGNRHIRKRGSVRTRFWCFLSTITFYSNESNPSSRLRAIFEFVILGWVLPFGFPKPLTFSQSSSIDKIVYCYYQLCLLDTSIDYKHYPIFAGYEPKLLVGSFYSTKSQSKSLKKPLLPNSRTNGSRPQIEPSLKIIKADCGVLLTFDAE